MFLIFLLIMRIYLIFQFLFLCFLFHFLFSFLRLYLLLTALFFEIFQNNSIRLHNSFGCTEQATNWEICVFHLLKNASMNSRKNSEKSLWIITEESKILRKILLKIFQWKSEKFVLVMKILKFFLKNNYRIFKSIITKQLEL